MLKYLLFSLGLILLTGCQNSQTNEAFNELRATAKASLTYGDSSMDEYSKQYANSMPYSKETPLLDGVKLMGIELKKSDNIIEKNLSNLDNPKADQLKICYKSLAQYYSKYLDVNIAVFRYVKYSQNNELNYWTETDIDNASVAIQNTWRDANDLRGELVKNCNL
jgi:hypothetical protein